MKIIFTAFCLIISTLAFSQTQSEMNSEAINNYNKSDKKLNQIYQQILREYKSDLIFIANFKNAQRIWIQFRDAEMKAKFPDNSSKVLAKFFREARSKWSKGLSKIMKSGF